MKHSRFGIGLISVIFALCLTAQSVDSENTGEHTAKPLWVVDGVALNDSVFGYTLDQMKSDSAAVLAAKALEIIYPPEIDSITVIDSVKASDFGFVDCNGVVKIDTSYRRPLLTIINGIPYESTEMVSAGDLLRGYDYLQPIINREFPDLKDYGIKDVKILKILRIPGIVCGSPRGPWVLVMTEFPYYRIEKLVGDYAGKSGKQIYELKLGADSTYRFSRKDTRKKAVVREMCDSGTWSIAKGNIALVLGNNPNVTPSNSSELSDTVTIQINSLVKLCLPKNAWGNKKPVKLEKHRDE